MTALFCDIVGSVSLTARLGPEDMMHVVDLYFEACDTIIAQYGGHIINYMGDGVLAYFGYPRANEDDTANAVRAGMALGEAARGLKLPENVKLQTRVGIATGLVVVSDLVGPGKRREADIVGDTPNLAARLQSVAQPDGIVVSAVTRKITRGLFVYKELGSFVLKGFDQPVEAFEPVEVTPVASRFLARVEGKAVPLMGREKELALMLDCWGMVEQGQGKIVVLQGEAGIGKSRLVEELRRHVADGPHAQLSWDCAPNYSDSALRPAMEAIARAANFKRSDTVPSRRGKLKALMERFGATDPIEQAVISDLLGLPPAVPDPAESLTPDRRKEVALDCLLETMTRLGTARPVLLVVEDLHWADSTTLELLDRMIRAASTQPWLILLTARPEFELRWTGRPNMALLPLGRLDLGNAERICAHLGADSLLPAALVGQIIARCDGIPLFVEEMTKSVLEQMAATPSGEGGTSAVVIPDTLQDSLVARLDRLGPARRIANLGAVIGRRFAYELLSAVAAQPEADLRQGLRDLTLSGLVERSGLPPASSYRFKHALIRDAAYESLFKRERQGLHGQIAAALKDRFPETAKAEPELLAYHLTESGAGAEAIPLWMAAGQRSALQAAHVEAVGHLQTALDLLRRQPDHVWSADIELGLLLGLAVSLAASQGYSVPDVGKVLTEARGICDRLGNVAGLFAVLRGICNFLIVAGDLPAAEETARRCVKIGEETGLAEQQIEGDCPLGYVLWAKGELLAAQFHLERAVSLYDRHANSRLAFPTPQDPGVVSLGALSMVLVATGDAIKREVVQAKLIAHSRSLDQAFSLSFGLSWHALADVAAGNYARALPFAAEALSICEAHGYATYGAVSFALKAAALGHFGDPFPAIDMLSKAIADFYRLGIKHSVAFHIGELARLYGIAGDLTTALQTVDKALTECRASGDFYFLPALLTQRAEILAMTPGGDQAARTADLQEAIAAAKAQGAAGFAARAAVLLERKLAPARRAAV